MHNDDVFSVGRLHRSRAQPTLQVARHSPHAHLGNSSHLLIIYTLSNGWILSGFLAEVNDNDNDNDNFINKHNIRA